MAVRNSASPMTLLSFDTAGLGGTYTLVGKTSQPLSILHVNNTSNTNVTISYDGTNDHDVFLANTDRIYHLQSNNQPQNNTNILPKNTPIYAKGSAGVGLIYFSGWYQISQT